MPTYVLEGGSSVTLPARPLTLRVQGRGQHEIRLEAWRDGAVDPTAISPMPGMLVLPRVSGPTEVRVVPAKDRTFPSGTVVALSAAIETHGDPDPERAVMHGVDLSGLAQRELVGVEPAGGEVRLTALGVVVDAPLPALAVKARDMARELLGMERVPGADATDLHVLVDASASMRPLVTDGSVGAALEAVVGVSRVTSAERRVDAAVGAATGTGVHGAGRIRAVTAESIADLPAAVHAALSEAPLLTGFRSSDGRRPPVGERTTLCVVSDGVPADLPIPSDAESVALVAIAMPSSRDVLAPRAPRTTAWVPVAEGGDQSAYALLLDGEAALRDVVASLLSALLPTGSAQRERLAAARDGFRTGRATPWGPR